MANENGAEAEDELWALGVGSDLPLWLRDLRQKEKSLGRNQGPRISAPRIVRAGIGPAASQSGVPLVSSIGSVEASPLLPVPRPRPAEPGVDPAEQSKSVFSPGRHSATSIVAPEAASVAPPAARLSSPASASEPPLANQKRVNPEDGRPYSLTETHERYKGHFSSTEIEAYFRDECLPLAPPIAAPASVQSQLSPTQRADSAQQQGSGSHHAAKPISIGSSHQNRHFAMSIKEWLAALDDSGFVAQYHDAISANFDSVEQIVDIYWTGKELDTQLFIDIGVKKLGHKRLFEKWFKDQLV